MSLTLPVAAPLDASVLTTQLAQAVPTVEGLTVVPGAVEIRRQAGDFTPAEVSTLQMVVAAHDPTAVWAERQARTLELRANALRMMTLAQGDSLVDGITTLANAKVVLKHIVRYLVARG